MIGKWIFRTAVLVVVVAYGTAERTRAESPWAMLMSPRRVEADPNRTYTIKEENGPWTIIACTFSGEGAEKQAHDLVLELRSRYKLEAYQHKMDFKLEDPNLPNQTPGTPPRYMFGWSLKRL